MSYIERKLTPELACYLLTTMRKAFQNFVWGQTSFNEKILNDIEIEMPILEPNTIDYDFIEHFIKAQEKIAVKEIID